MSALAGLLGNYDSDASDSDSDDEVTKPSLEKKSVAPPLATVGGRPKKPVSALPSAAELFADNDRKPARKLHNSSGVKSAAIAPKAAVVKRKATSTVPGLMAPPQLKRANIVTEETSSWTTNHKPKRD
jgi:hypothetical protein